MNETAGVCKRRFERERKARWRALQSQETLNYLREENGLAHSNQRANESHADRSIRLFQNSVRNTIKRSNENEDQRLVRRSHDAESHSRRFQTQRQTFYENQQQLIAEASQSQVVEPHTCGLLNILCQFCQARHFQAEKPRDGKFNSCCHKGKVRLPRRHRFPPYLQELMSNPNAPNYRNFKENIRSYNSAISFASMGAKLAGNAPGHGPYCFKVQGQIYHRTSHLHPPNDQQRKFAQLYVLDTTQAVEERLNIPENDNCLPNVLRELDLLMRQNPYAQVFKKLSEVEIEQQEHAQRYNLQMPRVNMVLRRDRHSDNRRYNLPTSNEVAMVFLNDDGEPPFQRDIRIYPRNNDQPFVNLNILSSNLDPMTYPVFYPNGEPGWTTNLSLLPYPGVSSGVRNNISMLQFKVSQTAVRDNEFNPILHGGKLAQQWIIDSHLQVEANNLNFIRQKQKQLRTEDYSGLRDFVAQGAADAGAIAGKTVILPSSFQGSPRNMRERYNDAMSIVTKFGKPDVFCTFTCNPQWPEIVTNLLPGQTSSDRPDLVARVFKIKLSALMNDITIGELFGKTVAHVYTIEFQKRGLPHAHILLILSESFKFHNAAQVDRCISSELPDPETYPRLSEIVLRTMVHGPCGTLNPNSPCMDGNKCTKDFPKAFQETTKVNVNGYPLYRRRQGPTALVRGKQVDNRYIVPYNAYLLLKYDAHINIEACTSIKSIKYIYKYIYKGYDAANVVVQAGNNENNEFVYDELSSHVDSRYVSAPEAMWRLLEFEMHHRSHAIIRLAIHLPLRQQVYFHAGGENAALEQAANRETMLTSWFELNRTDNEAKQYIYVDIPYHYVYQRNSWKKRQRRRDKIIPRLYSVNPKDTELFCLRLLLLYVPGATSFENLRTFDGHLYNTFQDTARARCLLAEDHEWDRCLEEATITAMPSQMRQTFVFICVFCNPTNAANLWEKYKCSLSEDYSRHYNESAAQNQALQDINCMLESHGFNCSSFNLPTPKILQVIQNEEFDHFNEAEIAVEQVATLNFSQRAAFNQIRSALESDSVTRRCFYLDGPGGSGKTYLYNVLMHFVRGKCQVVLPHATTGIAAILLKGGRTVHSGFKLPVPILETSTSAIRMSSSEAETLREAKLIIIDEVTMMSCHALRCIDVLLREIMLNDMPFGGKVMLLGGDFRQTLPVVIRGNRTEIIETCLKSSPLWQEFVLLKLSENMRSEGQNIFNEWQLKIGEGKTPNIPNLPAGTIEIPPAMVCKDSIITSVYGNHIKPTDFEQLEQKVILTTKNKHALALNNMILNLLPEDGRTYYSADSVVSDNQENIDNYSPEFLHEQTPSGMPPHKLTLKKGSIIMLLRNMNPKKGLCNGTRLIVHSLHNHFIDAFILTGTNRNHRVHIPRIDLTPSETSLPFILKRRQFPVILSFAMTINKSQGQTFSTVGLYLKEPVFSHGQLYVSISRCKEEGQLKICIEDTEEQGQLLNNERVFTKNIVYPEVL